jgi:hypothetical protein
VAAETTFTPHADRPEIVYRNRLRETPIGGLELLFANNRAWPTRTVAQDPPFFTRLAVQQAPKYLWIRLLIRRELFVETV